MARAFASVRIESSIHSPQIHGGEKLANKVTVRAVPTNGQLLATVLLPDVLRDELRSGKHRR